MVVCEFVKISTNVFHLQNKLDYPILYLKLIEWSNCVKCILLLYYMHLYKETRGQIFCLHTNLITNYILQEISQFICMVWCIALVAILYCVHDLYKNLFAIQYLYEVTLIETVNVFMILVCEAVTFNLCLCKIELNWKSTTASF